MSSAERRPERLEACTICMRRCWLLAALSGVLDCCCRDRARLREVLALPDAELIAALGGRQRATLQARYDAFQATELRSQAGVESRCPHRPGYPPQLGSQPGAARGPALLNIAGGADRLATLASSPLVALHGSRQASDYGLAIAASLGRSLSASGVTLVSALTAGVASAAQAGALELRGPSIVVMGSGLGARRARARRGLYGRVLESGCAISELPNDCDGRRWGELAAERTLVGLAQVVVVVEAEQREQDLSVARLGRELGRTLAALPGRVSSPLSAGAHDLIREGAHLVRGAQDILELLGESHSESGLPGGRHRLTAGRAIGCANPLAQLDSRLRAVLADVGGGSDTAEKLIRRGGDAAGVLLALSELEVAGLLRRGDGGRYVPCTPSQRWQ